MEHFQLHAGEQVVLKVRRHPLILVGQLIPIALLDYLPYLLPGIGTYLMATNPASMIDFAALLSFDNPWMTFVVGIYWLFLWMITFGAFTDYYLDQWVVTNERIIEIDQKSFWHRTVSSLFLNRVQNVETDVDGFFNTLFGFGRVSVESAGAEINRIRMSSLGNPEHVRDVILREHARYVKEHVSSLPS